jgi:hypothetical protein
MSWCDYCESDEGVVFCEGCPTRVCERHYEMQDGFMLCNPPADGSDVGRGCYRPPVAEVAE